MCKDFAIQDDIRYELDEQFSISLSTSTQNVIAFLPLRTTVTIIDDDSECMARFKSSLQTILSYIVNHNNIFIFFPHALTII